MVTRRSRSKPRTRKPSARAKAKAPVTGKKSAARRKPNVSFMKPMTPASTLAAVVGSNPMPRAEVTSKLWDYIRKNGLQDKADKRMINADDKLKAVFGGRSRVSSSEVEARAQAFSDASAPPRGITIRSLSKAK